MNKAKNWANSANFNQTTEQAQNWFTKFINWIKSLFTSNNTQSTPDSINEQSSINE